MAVRARAGIAAGAGLPGTHLPGHRFVRQAGRVIVGLLLTGLAAAAVWVLLAVVVVVVAALAGGLGPHFPGPPPHPVPVPNPAPAPPGS